ncbi:MAG: 2-amino-4-hydroxy-6-hydroxymethyldihydropteridine diphosphokinase [Ktedonobacterales bacterium]
MSPIDEQAQQPAHIHQVCLGLGANLGDRDASLRRATAALQALSPMLRPTRVSSIYDTAPELETEQPRFHNAACVAQTTLEPRALLRALKRIEMELGRAPTYRYGPRAIDLDILLYDELILTSDELSIPHPRLAERAFALVPLAEIAPDLVHPVLGMTISQLAASQNTADVRRLGPLIGNTAALQEGPLRMI